MGQHGLKENLWRASLPSCCEQSDVKAKEQEVEHQLRARDLGLDILADRHLGLFSLDLRYSIMCRPATKSTRKCKLSMVVPQNE